MDWRSAVYEQCANIDLNDYYDANGGASASQFVIEGAMGESFSGIYNGNRYKISHFTYLDPTGNNLALFGSIQGAVIKNLVIEGAQVQGSYNISALVAEASGSNLIENIDILGADLEGGNTGGVLGSFMGNSGDQLTIKNIYIDRQTRVSGGGPLSLIAASINGSGNVLISRVETHGFIDGPMTGGLGSIAASLSGENATIDQVYSTAKIRMNMGHASAGLIGLSSSDLTLTNCVFAGTLESDYGHFAGLTTYATGTIKNCYSSSSFVTNIGGPVAGLFVGGDGGLEDSFSAGERYAGDPANPIVAYTYTGMTGFNNVYYSDTTTCLSPGCNAIIPGVSPTNPINFTTKAGIDSLFGVGAWDFENIWKEVPGAYPRLRFARGP